MLDRYVHERTAESTTEYLMSFVEIHGEIFDMKTPRVFEEDVESSTYGSSIPGLTDRWDNITVDESLYETKDEITIHDDSDDTVNIGNSNTILSMIVVSKLKNEDKNKTVIHND